MEGTHSALALQQVGKVRVGQGGGSHKVTWVYDMTMLCSLANTANRNTHTRTHTHTHTHTCMHTHIHVRAHTSRCQVFLSVHRMECVLHSGGVQDSLSCLASSAATALCNKAEEPITGGGETYIHQYVQTH